MVKLTKSYENGTITSTLVFRGESYTMTDPPPNRGVRETLEPCYDFQFKAKYPDDPYLEEITELMSNLSFGESDDEIEEALSELLYLEEDLT